MRLDFFQRTTTTDGVVDFSRSATATRRTQPLGERRGHGPFSFFIDIPVNYLVGVKQDPLVLYYVQCYTAKIRILRKAFEKFPPKGGELGRTRLGGGLNFFGKSVGHGKNRKKCCTGDPLGAQGSPYLPRQSHTSHQLPYQPALFLF